VGNLYFHHTCTKAILGITKIILLTPNALHMKTELLFVDTSRKSSSLKSRRFPEPGLSNKIENMPDSGWEDVAVNTAFVTKAVYYMGKENGRTTVTTIDIIEWLKKHHYKIDKQMVRDILNTLSSTGIISKQNSSPIFESWEWQLREI
jgi:hypothetical protein